MTGTILQLTRDYDRAFGKNVAMPVKNSITSTTGGGG